jgi:hypothetical protein
LAEAESERVKARAAAGEDLAPSRKRRLGAAAVPGIEVIGSESYTGRKSAADTIDLEYIQWGFSQKVQLAGVRALSLPNGCSEPKPSPLLISLPSGFGVELEGQRISAF